MSTNVHFSNTLKRIRSEKGLSQAVFSELIDIPLNTYKSYELGRREPALSIAVHISEKLNIPIGELTGSFIGKEEKPTPQQQPETFSNTIDLMTENMKRLQEAFGHVPDDIIELLSLIDNEKAWRSAKLYLTGVVELDTKNADRMKEKKKEIG